MLPPHALAISLPPRLNISYASSVDGFPLSYDEWLPAGYSSSETDPLVVFLHGIGTTPAWVPGGTNRFVAVLPTPTTDGATERALLANASAYGFIFTSLNTRSSSGFYADTPCGGPQGQDLLDAIAHEKALRNVSDVYLMGYSMGSMGALENAGRYPGLFKGIALSAPATDLYEQYAYETRHGPLPAGSGPGQMLYDNCGVAPSPANTTVDSNFFGAFSALRFHPENFSNLSIWVSSGGLDPSTTNNATRWPFLQVNSTFVTSTCHYASALGEPAGCTTPLWNLSLQHPGQYRFRFVYEPQGTHLLTQLAASDIFGFWTGNLSPGVFTSSFPPGPIRPVGLTPPLVIVSFAANPATVYVGSGVALNVTAMGGTPAYSYAYSGLPSGCDQQNSSSLTCVPDLAGTFVVRVTIADGGGLSAFVELTLEVLTPSLPPTYSVSFEETGLPSGSNWSVTLGPRTVSGNSSTLDLEVGNGSLPFWIASTWAYRPNPDGGTILVNGSDIVLPVDFSRYYRVTFVERGLPTGASWGVDLNGSLETTTGAQIEFQVANGTDSFAVEAPTGVVGGPLTGVAHVLGADLDVNLTFNQTFLLTFQEIGLPPAYNWSATVNGTIEATTATSMVFSEIDGQVGYQIGELPGYLSTPSSGTALVRGGSVNVTITFQPVYLVTINESGLPSGFVWSIVVNGSAFDSEIETIVLSLPNGTYNLSVSPVAGYLISPTTATLTVNGTNLSAPVVFAALFAVTFSQTGLPSGSTWSVTLANDPLSTMATTLSFNRTNGTYAFSVGAVSGYSAAPAAGSAVVNGSSILIAVVYADGTAPTTSDSISSGTSGQNGWFVSPSVTVLLSATDGPGGSGVASLNYSLDGHATVTTPAGQLSLTVSGDGIHTLVYSSEDFAGNREGAQTSSVKIDSTIPSLHTAHQGSVLILGNGAIAPSFTYSDTISGIAGCHVTTSNGKSMTCAAFASSRLNTSSVGPHWYLVAASDSAGNSATLNVTYSVQYRFGGFLAPLVGSPTFSKGTSIAVKFKLSNSGLLLVTKATGSVYLDGVAAQHTGSINVLNFVAYSTANHFYVFNLSTKGYASGTHVISVLLDDGTSHTVSFTLT